MRKFRKDYNRDFRKLVFLTLASIFSSLLFISVNK